MQERKSKARRFVARQDEPFNGGPPVDMVAADYLTPTDLFFVRSHAPVPAVERAAYRLRVEGAVERPLALSLGDLASGFARTTVTAAVHCAGLRRDELMAEADIPGELPWSGDAIGNAVWGGVRLAEVLAAAAADRGRGGAHVAFTGLDRVERDDGATPFGGSVPAAKAWAAEVLLADEMNGEPLPAVHGGPLRVLVPGYIGARSVKWLAAVRVQARPSPNHYQQQAYRLTPGRPDDPEPARPGPMLGDLLLNCAISGPQPGARLPAGRVNLRGWAVAGGGAAVSRVEVSGDDGATWHPARLLDRAEPWAWRRWRASLELAPGAAVLVARAFDAAGGEQPPTLEQVWNRQGYMNNAWHRVPVRVEAP